MKAKFLFYLFFLFFVYSCSKPEIKKEVETKTSDQNMSSHDSLSDSSSSLMNDGQPLIVKSELQDFSSLPVDSMIINLGGMKDVKIYGFRKENILIAEGDMVFKYSSSGVKYKFGVGTGSSARRWTIQNSSIVVPYTINNSFSNEAKQDIELAFKLWEEKLNIKFVNRNSEPAYINFIPSSSTRSFVGKQGNGQTIELANWAKSGNIAHEIGHALGLFHEHTRSDRDGYITINPNCQNNINYKHAFKTDYTAEDVGEYDLNSIMHYSANLNCFTVKISGLKNGIPGQRDSVSKGDFLTIKKLYAIN